MIGLAILAVLYGLVFCGLWAAEKGVQSVNDVDPIEGERFDLPRIGGVIEDETGWWQIVEIDTDIGGAWLMDRHGKEQFRPFEHLGHVSYPWAIGTE